SAARVFRSTCFIPRRTKSQLFFRKCSLKAWSWISWKPLRAASPRIEPLHVEIFPAATIVLLEELSNVSAILFSNSSYEHETTLNRPYIINRNCSLCRRCAAGWKRRPGFFGPGRQWQDAFAVAVQG